MALLPVWPSGVYVVLSKGRVGFLTRPFAQDVSDVARLRRILQGLGEQRMVIFPILGEAERLFRAVGHGRIAASSQL